MWPCRVFNPGAVSVPVYLCLSPNLFVSPPPSPLHSFLTLSLPPFWALQLTLWRSLLHKQPRVCLAPSVKVQSMAMRLHCGGAEVRFKYRGWGALGQNRASLHHGGQEAERMTGRGQYIYFRGTPPPVPPSTVTGPLNSIFKMKSSHGVNK